MLFDNFVFKLDILPNPTQMNKYITIINKRTYISLIIAIAVLFVSFTFEFSYDIDLTLLSIAIIFPLVFNIRGSFRRREKALEHLSQFRSSLKTLSYYFICAPGLTEEDKEEAARILVEISDKTMVHLEENEHTTKNLDESINKVFLFVTSKDTLISKGLKDKIWKYLNDLHESIENLHAINTHRTPVSLKAYCEFFIYIFPLIYAPAILFRVGMDADKWVTIFIVLFSEFILISLYNIQDQMEYPFDNVGLDDIHLSMFKIDR